MSNRLKRWWEFAKIVGEHIESYTVPQYGDYPDDQLTTAKISDLTHDVRRYCNRSGSNSRGPEEELLDAKKMAHYACEIYLKKREELHGEK